MRPHRTLIRLVVVLALVGQISSWRVSNSDQFDQQKQDSAHDRSRLVLADSPTGWRQISSLGGSGPIRSLRKSTAWPAADIEVVSLETQKPTDRVKPQAQADKSAASPRIQWDDEGSSNETDDEDDEDDADDRRSSARKQVHRLQNASNSKAASFGGNLFGTTNSIEKDERFTLKNAHTTNKFRHVAPYDRPKYSKSLFGLLETPSRSSGKLIYHGRLSGGGLNSSRVQRRVVAGLEMQIDTHKPVAISRFSPLVLDGANTDSANNLFMFRSGSSARPPQTAGEEQDAKIPVSTSSLQEQSASSSDWRPIVVASGRMRRSGKTQSYNSWGSGAKSHDDELKLISGANKNELMVTTLSPVQASKWRPLTGSHRLATEAKSNGGTRADKSTMSSSSWTASNFGIGSNSNLSRKNGLDSGRNIEQPFDRDEEFEFLNQRDDDEKRRDSPSADLPRLNPADKWKPLETTTPRSDELLTSGSTTAAATVEPTTQPSVADGNRASNSSVEAAQKSASDLSYIYSSQPDSGGHQSLVQQQVSTNPYYGQPQTQPQVDLPVQQIASAIVDTTSGQTPEMVPDRASVESYPMRDPYGTYSDLQTINFPPAQAPAVSPMRQQSAYYGGAPVATSSVSLLDSGSYYQPPARSAQIQPQQPAMRQSFPSPPQQQLIRQEHHHHYYNQHTPSTQSAERQQAPSQAPATVIRELQPIMISQPAVVQQPSSTAAPPTQIIREIIKEVPMQAIQVQPVQVPARLVVQSVLAPPIPVIPPMPNLVREAGSSSYESPTYGIAPAKRFMRQLTESMPQVAIRMPPTIRLQVPTIQALRSASAPASTGLTRQTGSFVVPPRPKKTTTLMTETQEIPLHTTIIHSTEYTPATRTTVYTTDHRSSKR